VITWSVALGNGRLHDHRGDNLVANNAKTMGIGQTAEWVTNKENGQLPDQFQDGRC
jgi:hypothetical protein